MACFQLIYSSLAAQEITDDVLLDILNKSQNNNYTLKISGLLVFHDDRFMQLLEGSEKDVRQLLEKIQRDPRHTEIKVVYESMSRSRSMPGWAMAFTLLDSSVSCISDEKFYIPINEINAIFEVMDGSVGQLFLEFFKAP